MTKLVKAYDFILETLLALLFSGMILLMFTEVVARHVFNSPIIWSEELGRMMFIYCVFLGAALAFLSKSHIAVDYFSQLMPAKLRVPTEMLVNILLLALLVFLVIKGYQFALGSFDEPAYSIPYVNLGWAYLAVPLGALVMFINLARAMLRKDHSQ
ncbi:MAG: TRAP transporter small permease [Desulfarculaceae bacterium]|jgi:TRAP-type C4-dicarboxylate transport system permease small subunit